MVSIKDIRAVGRRIGREFRPQRVILFGSHARGTAGPDSDVGTGNGAIPDIDVIRKQ